MSLATRADPRARTARASAPRYEVALRMTEEAQCTPAPEAIDRVNAGEALAEAARTFGVDRVTLT
jgi:hypothetical protein